MKGLLDWISTPTGKFSLIYSIYAIVISWSIYWPKGKEKPINDDELRGEK